MTASQPFVKSSASLQNWPCFERSPCACACRCCSASCLRWDWRSASACSSCMPARAFAPRPTGRRALRAIWSKRLCRDLTTAPDPQAEIARLLADARRLRHVRVTLAGEETPAQKDVDRAPQWFARLVLPNAAVTRIETGRGAILIAPNPADEIAEIWQEIVWLTIGGAGIVGRRLRTCLARRVANAASRRDPRRWPAAAGARRTFGARSRRRLSGIHHHRRAHQRSGGNPATARRRKSPARAAHDPCAGRRAQRHRARPA